MDCGVLKISPIGFGAFKIGRNEGVKYPRRYDLPDAAAVDRLLNSVLDLGVSYIDTAPAYGLSEERIGQSIAHRRDEYILSTKVGETFDDGRSTYDYSGRAIRSSLHRSLQRLRTEALDFVFVHSNGDDLEILRNTDVIPTLRALRDEGLIKAIGLSGYTADGFKEALDWADAIMVEYHLENRSLEPVIASAAERGTLVMVKKGLRSGRLDPEESIRFVLANQAVTSLVIGGLSIDHIQRNMSVARSARGAEAEAGGAQCDQQP
ncbi:MAG: aldo/keto reductase [Planctomycetes bacterium]|nr:aldo/keto reductase [Planctomycetota bacterium]